MWRFRTRKTIEHHDELNLAREPEYEFLRYDIEIIAVLMEREGTSAETDSSRGKRPE
jgi:hypothetical protein